MRPLFAMTAILQLILASLLWAGFELGISGGYGTSAGGLLQTTNSTYDANTPTGGGLTDIQHSYVSLGNGLKLDADLTLFVSDNLGVMLASGFSTMGGYTREHTSQDVMMTPPVQYTKIELASSYLPINLGLKFRAPLGSMMPYAYVAPGLYVPVSVEETGTNNTSDWTTTYAFDMGFGFSSGIGIVAGGGSNVSFKIEINANYAFAAINQTTEVLTDKQTGQQATYITNFVNNNANLKDRVTVGTTTTDESAGKFQFSFSSIAIKAGFIVGF